MGNRSKIRKAYQLIKEELRACYDDFGIVGGKGHYDDYWSRDAAFGCLGAMAVNDIDIVKKQLSFWASLQRNDGMIPFLCRKFFPGLVYFGLKIKTRLRPKYRNHKALFLSEVIDSNPYFVIVFAELLKKTKDRNLLEKYSNNIEKSLFWCLKKMRKYGSLAVEGPIAEWNDAVYKTGRTLMTNVLFFKAFKDWENICFEYGWETKGEFFGIASKIKTAIQKEFWNGDYFIDWIDYRKHDYFDSNANFLAIIWGIAEREQSESIIDFTYRNLFDSPFIKIAYPDYPWRRAEIFNRIFGMAGYVNDLFWPDPVCLFVWVLNLIDRKIEAQNLLSDLSELFARDNGIYEVYDMKTKKPLKRWNYKSEFPYARGSGLFILAFSSVFGDDI